MKKLFAGIFLFMPLCSNAFIFIDPVNLIQNTISAINSISLLVNQVRGIKSQIENYRQNLRHLGSFHYQDIGNVISQLDNITRQGQSISYAMQNVDSKFKQYYPDYSEQQDTTNYQQAYQGWNKTTMTTFSNSLRAIGSNTESVRKEDQLMQQLKAQSQSAQGRTQVMQTANEMAVENIRQLESLKHLIAAQSNAQTAYMASQVSKNSFEQKSLDEIVKQTPTQFPSYRNCSAFGKIKQGSSWQ